MTSTTIVLLSTQLHVVFAFTPRMRTIFSTNTSAVCEFSVALLLICTTWSHVLINLICNGLVVKQFVGLIDVALALKSVPRVA